MKTVAILAYVNWRKSLKTSVGTAFSVRALGEYLSRIRENSRLRISRTV